MQTVGGAELTQEEITSTERAYEAGVRKLAGMQPGRIVNYVMKGGEIRPLLLVRVIDSTGVIAGVLFFDGVRDSELFPQSLGQVITKDAFTRTHVTQWVQEASFDDEGDLEGTWHWPSRQPVMASGVDAAVLETLRDQLTASFNAKLAATVGSIKEMLNDYDLTPKRDTHAEEIEDAQNNHGQGMPPLPTLAVPKLSELKPDPEVRDGRKEAAEEEVKNAAGGSQG